MTSILTFISVIGLTAIWLLGWMGVTLVAGAFFDMPITTCALVGLTLGPLGFIVIVLVGIAERMKSDSKRVEIVTTSSAAVVDTQWDPFA